MSTCQSWQAPYSVGNVPGATAEGACAAYAAATADQWGDPKPVFPWSLSGDTCIIDQSQFGQSAVATVVHVCDATTQNELSIPLLQLSPEQGAAIGAAILLVWVVGFGYRMLIRAVRPDEARPENDM